VFYTLIEDTKIDACIKKTMKDKEYIKNKEFYKALLFLIYFFIKSSIFKFIHKCNNKIKTICCGYCKKNMSFTGASEHKCKLI
jgi:hypothetical protein